MSNKTEQPPIPEREEETPEAEKKIISIEEARKTPEQERREFFEAAENFVEQTRIKQKMREAQEREQFEQQKIEAVKARIAAAEKEREPEPEEKGFGQKLKDGMTKLRFRLSGVKDPEQMLELVHYLEENVFEEHARQVTDQEGTTQEVYEHYKFKPGYKKEVLKTLNSLTNLKNDAAEAIRELQKTGLKLNSQDIHYSHIGNLQELIDSPNVIQNLEGLRNAGIGLETMDINNKGHIQDWQAALTDETLKETLVPEVQEKILELRVMLNEKIDPSNIKEYFALAQNQDTCRFIETLSGPNGLWDEKRRHAIGIPYCYDLAYKLKVLQDEGLIAKMLPLAEAGLDQKEFADIWLKNWQEKPYEKNDGLERHRKRTEKREEWRKSFTDKEAEELKEKLKNAEIENIPQNKELKDYIGTVAALTKEKINTDTLRLLKETQDDENFIPLLYLFNKYEGKAGLPHTSALCERSKKTVEKLFSKDFQKFADNIMNKFPDGLAFFDNSIEKVLELYNNEKIRQKLLNLDENGWELMRFLKESKEGKQNTFKQEMIPFLDKPELLDTLKQFRECYGYYCGGDNAELYYLKNLSESNDLKDYEKVFNFVQKNPGVKEIIHSLSTNVALGAAGGYTKFITNIPLLEKINENKAAVDPTIFAKYPSFYLDSRMIGFLEQNPDKFQEVYSFHQSLAPCSDYLSHATLLPIFAGSIEKILENKKLFEPADLEKYQKFYSDEKVITFLSQNPQKLLEVYSLPQSGILNKKELMPVFVSNLKELLNIPENQREKYIEICEHIDKSPSQEMQRIKFELINGLLQTENPLAAYQRVESIFIKNNLPLAGKIYKVFAALYPPEKLEGTLKSGNLSPYLAESKTRKRNYTIYQDLLKVHIESGNRNLRDYLNILQSGQSVLDKAEKQGVENLNVKDTQELKYFLLKIQTLFENSQLGRRMSPEGLGLKNDLLNAYQELKTSLSVKEGQTVTERIAEMFLKPLGYKNIGEVLIEMKKSKLKAHKRGLGLVEKAKDGHLELKEGDLLKGVNTDFITSILQNGSVAKEFLGAAAVSDYTPFDTDVSMVLKEETTEGGFKNVVDKSLAQKYGNLLFAVKDRGQYQLTTKENIKDYDPGKLELFKTGVTGQQHYGIRTGFPITEIDFMIAQDELLKDEKKLQETYFEIAQNGYYIPVTDTEGKIIFTPKQYQEIRQIFQGLDRFDGESFEFIPTTAKDFNHREVAITARQLKENRERVAELSGQIRQVAKEILEENGVAIKDEHDTGIVGAELLDTGSTGRNTNAIGDYDFDLALRIDSKDVEKVGQIAEATKKRLKPQEDKSHSLSDGLYQIRAFGCQSFGEKTMDIDVGFVKKSELVYFGSHEAVAERLNWIKNNIGDNAYEQTLANVILAKQILKEGKAYKKVEHGGMGGIGVENWVLANGGNMLRAFESFRDTAYKKGKLVPLDEFKKQYKIIDPGANVQKFGHDNYVDYLTENGYKAMAKTIEDYFGKAQEMAMAA